MLFKEVIGHEDLKKRLRNAVRNGRVSHAQLFLGHEGSGNLSLALAYAQYILCENKTEDDSCGTCRNCVKVGKHIHPDVHFSFPSIGSKAVSDTFLKEWREALSENTYLNTNQWLQKIGAENKQGNITKDECLQVIKKLSLKAFEAEYKVLILWRPEYLGKEGNRLLKLIEEPPEGTVFLLVAEEEERILNTILSRCQLVKVNQLSDQEIVAGLIKMGMDPEKAKTSAFLSDGNFNEAMHLVEHLENDHLELLLSWFRAGFKGKPSELVKMTDQLAKLGRENQKHLLKYVLYFFRAFIVIKTAGPEGVRLKPREMEAAKNLTKAMSFEQATLVSEVINECVLGVERNANPKILFLDASIKLSQIFKNQFNQQAKAFKIYV